MLTTQKPLSFFSMEVTRRCNGSCDHCCTCSGPYCNDDTLTLADQLDLLDQAAAAGCKAAQFIGGEPTLKEAALIALIEHAYALGFSTIELFTNGTRMSDRLFTVIVKCGVSVATTVYSHIAAIHDDIMHLSGSHAKTIATIRRLVEAGVPLRVAVIRMEVNAETVDDTVAFLQAMGVTAIGIDDARPVGRRIETHPKPENPCEGLCGQCTSNSLAVTARGTVHLCTMSHHLQVGDTTQGIAAILQSERMHEVCAMIDAHFGGRELHAECNPDKKCSPTTLCTPHCSPNFCGPKVNCNPKTPCKPSKRN